MDEVHIFAASGLAVAANTFHTVGERHELLVFVGQLPGSDHDWEAAKQVLLDAGWDDISFDRASIAQDPSAIADGTLKQAIAHAAQGNSSILVYGAVEKRT